MVCPGHRQSFRNFLKAHGCESLSAILEHRSFRLTPLSLLDDMLNAIEPFYLVAACAEVKSLLRINDVNSLTL